MPFVAAFDLATATGCADGAPGAKPRLWTWNLKTKAGKDRASRLAELLECADLYFANHTVTHVAYEAPMPLAAMIQRGASEHVVQMLRGSIGVLEAVARKHHVPHIEPVKVAQARVHLCGRGIPKGMGKPTVFKMCQMLGWQPADFEQSDAAAIWAYAGARANPRTAHLTTELFR